MREKWFDAEAFFRVSVCVTVIAIVLAIHLFTLGYMKIISDYSLYLV